jgi:hypothetical protein
LIKPFLGGKDIKKYIPPSPNKYIILIPKGFTIKKNLPESSPYHVSEPPPRYGNMDTLNGWEWFKSTYPAIAQHLLPFRPKAEVRTDKGDFWWELRACDYYDEFERPKIIFPDIAKESRMSYSKGVCYLANTAYSITTDNLAILGILNSKLIYYYYSKITSVLGDAENGGRLRWIFQYVSPIPFPLLGVNSRIEILVNQILAAKEADPSADTTALEAEIDQLVYQLYGLTEEEIRIVEESVG